MPMASRTLGNVNISTAPSRNPVLTLPSALVWSGDRPLVTLAAVPASALDAPFLDMALDSGAVRGFVPLDAAPVSANPLPIAGAIHHMTRCGSTLLCRQFGALDRVVALSEPFAFQHLLEGPAAPPATTQRRIRQLATLWCEGLAPIADRVVIKWSSLIGQHAATMAAALDEVPMLFLHREPVEVLASIEAEPLGGNRHVQPRHLAPLPDGQSPNPRNALETSARLIARTLRAAAGTPNLRTLDFAELPAAAWERVAPYFGFDLSRGDLDSMRAAAAFHSKDRSRTRTFAPDGQAKRDSSSAAARGLAADIVAPALAALLEGSLPLGTSPRAGTMEASR